MTPCIFIHGKKAYYCAHYFKVLLRKGMSTTAYIVQVSHNKQFH